MSQYDVSHVPYMSVGGAEETQNRSVLLPIRLPAHTRVLIYYWLLD